MAEQEVKIEVADETLQTVFDYFSTSHYDLYTWAEKTDAPVLKALSHAKKFGFAARNKDNNNQLYTMVFNDMSESDKQALVDLTRPRSGHPPALASVYFSNGDHSEIAVNGELTIDR